jgi:hypothetical protein
VRKETRPYLGVMTAPLPPPLSAQLSMPEGFGLIVLEVAPESPAAKSGVQKYDVLKMLNDQQIVDQNQLATLVKGIGAGKEVGLTLVRKAQEQKLSVTISEHTVTVREGDGPGHAMFGGPGFPGVSPEMKQRMEELMRKSHDAADGVKDKMREFQDRMKSRRDEDRKPGDAPRDGDRKPGDAPRDGDRPREGRPNADINPERLLRAAQAASGARILVESDSGSTTIDSSQARLHLKDSSGEIEVSAQNGKRVLTAHDADGKLVFTGPVNTEEERAAIPEPIRKKLAEIHVRQESRPGSAIAEVSVGTPLPGKPDEADFQ